MARTPIGSLASHVGEAVEIAGWVHAVRATRNILFVVVRDRTGSIQLTHKELTSPLGQTLAGLTAWSTVRVHGTVAANPAVKLGGLELLPSAVDVDTRSPTWPIDPENADLDKRMDWRFLDLRRPRNNLVFRVQTTIEHAMREYWVEQGFIEIHSPKLMATASESGAELFRVDYFGRNAYLAQSPQFYKQMGIAAGFDRVFEIGPVFRANPSFTSRHDTEFTSVDVEMAWVDSHEDVMRFEEGWLRHVLARVQERHGEEIRSVFGREVRVPSVPFPRVRLAEALRTVSGGDGAGAESTDLSPDQERALHQQVLASQGHDFVFVTDYPVSVRPFYHMAHPEAPSLTRSFDLLFEGVEITTGAQREHRYETLRHQAEAKGLDPDRIQFYLDFFRYGCPPHGGFGFGLTRFLMLILGLRNVREVTYLYRGPDRLTP